MFVIDTVNHCSQKWNMVAFFNSIPTYTILRIKIHQCKELPTDAREKCEHHIMLLHTSPRREDRICLRAWGQSTQSKPLTINMLIESTKIVRWLYE